jgi:hypothetical protein
MMESLKADSERSEWGDLEVLGYYWGSVFCAEGRGKFSRASI